MLYSLILSFLIKFSSCFNTINCSLNGEGIWGIGLITGSTLFDLTTPIDPLPSNSKISTNSHSISSKISSKTLSNSSSQGTCHRNPIISCIDILDTPTAFVADPFLYIENNEANNTWYAFYELKNMNSTVNRRRGQIGLSESYDQVIEFSFFSFVCV